MGTSSGRFGIHRGNRGRQGRIKTGKRAARPRGNAMNGSRQHLHCRSVDDIHGGLRGIGRSGRGHPRRSGVRNFGGKAVHPVKCGQHRR